jgi:hypothetical protein
VINWQISTERTNQRQRAQKKTVETGGKVVTFQMESLVPTLPKLTKLRGCEEMVPDHDYLALKSMFIYFQLGRNLYPHQMLLPMHGYSQPFRNRRSIPFTHLQIERKITSGIEQEWEKLFHPS